MIHKTMKPIIGTALFAMILHLAESGPFGQGPGYGGRGDYSGPPAGRCGNGDQKASQGGIMDMLSGLVPNLGLPNPSFQGGQQDKLQGLGQLLGSRSEDGNGNCPLSGLLQKAGSNGNSPLSGLLQKAGSNGNSPLSGLLQKAGSNGNCPLSGLLQKAGSALGSGGGLNGLLQGLGNKFSGKAQKSGSSGGCGGRRKKSGSCNQGAQSGRNGYGSDYGDGEEEWGRAGGYGSHKGGRRGRNSGYKRQTTEYDEEY
ncbi:uncharacterized protein LOC143806518 [Ranitomeya variabilis]|uniref:uncharacterized protein LOC143806518 n=1 Tax=Ranitomeya variabilis TaxID=490064 RepID=UPI004055F9CB